MNGAARWKAALVLTLVLVSGIGLGIVIDRAFLARRGALPPGEFMSPWRMGRVLARLDLTPEQRARVDSLLAARRRDLDRVREEVRPELEHIRVVTEAEVRAVLTPEQAAQFDRNLERMRRFGPHRPGFERRFGPRGPRGRPDPGDEQAEPVPPPSPPAPGGG